LVLQLANADLQGTGMASRTNSDLGGVFIPASDAAEIARLLRLLEPPHGNNHNPDPEEDAKQDNRPSGCSVRTQLQARAQAIFNERNRRTQFFSKSIFGEPAWEMLLSLYVLDGRRVTIGRLVGLIDAPQTTALRWLEYLERKPYVVRRSDPDDRRVVCIEIADEGRELLDAYFSTLPEGFSALG
jgi:DNA-binding MarR family transcriptional regulator